MKCSKCSQGATRGAHCALLLSLRPVRPKTIRIRPPSEYPGRRLAHVRAPSPGPGSRTQSGLRLFRGRREKFAKNFARQGSLRGQRALGAVRCMQRAVAFRGDAETCLDPGLRRDDVGFGASAGDRSDGREGSNAHILLRRRCGLVMPSSAGRRPSKYVFAQETSALKRVVDGRLRGHDGGLWCVGDDTMKSSRRRPGSTPVSACPASAGVRRAEVACDREIVCRRGRKSREGRWEPRRPSRAWLPTCRARRGCSCARDARRRAGRPPRSRACRPRP
jgi:hypothetical protein